jgi:hypothetical protein
MILRKFHIRQPPLLFLLILLMVTVIRNRTNAISAILVLVELLCPCLKIDS